MKKTDAIIFRTSDIGLSAYVEYLGCKMEHMDIEECDFGDCSQFEIVFNFSVDSETHNKIVDFVNYKKCLVEPKKYLEIIERITSLAKNARFCNGTEVLK